jgi:hypothetical protein
MKKLELDKEIRNPMLNIPYSTTLEMKPLSETVIVQPSNREIAEKVNEIIDLLDNIKGK